MKLRIVCEHAHATPAQLCTGKHLGVYLDGVRLPLVQSLRVEYTIHGLPTATVTFLMDGIEVDHCALPRCAPVTHLDTSLDTDADAVSWEGQAAPDAAVE